MKEFVGSWPFLGTWLVLSVVCLAIVIRDLRRKNPEIMPLMRFVWGLTVAYSGPLGLAAYFFAGRKQIDHDSLLRRGLRSTAHCYSGCGLGEVLGVLLTVGVFGATQSVVIGTTFGLAYLLGLGLTAGPLIQDGESKRAALKDALISESASIVVMELVAISVDLLLAGNAGWSEVLFWSSLVVSLTLGFLAALPVNILFVRWGVKEGMKSPKAMAA
ncbi:MAG: DUF4396 domain-containing protein [Candidatus Eisenbacteria bacterium]|uniref:DUF4396 domain-containing protein n=1 Tax=Eiseniibacteriota bacterium TaxID=2212470 RepID=A0A956N9U6_UNCEI|nr:DUF4396 domain-containing protein [Candidatus Eisenbacteria bacterium]